MTKISQIIQNFGFENRMTGSQCKRCQHQLFHWATKISTLKMSTKKSRIFEPKNLADQVIYSPPPPKLK